MSLRQDIFSYTVRLCMQHVCMQGMHRRVVMDEKLCPMVVFLNVMTHRCPSFKHESTKYRRIKIAFARLFGCCYDRMPIIAR